MKIRFAVASILVACLVLFCAMPSPWNLFLGGFPAAIIVVASRRLLY